MKIGGPKGPVTTPKVSEESTPARADRSRFSEVLRGGETEPLKAPLADTMIAELRTKLTAGEISPAEAVEILVESVVNQRAAQAPPEVQERLRTSLRKIVAEDPLLAEKIDKLKQLGDDGDDH